MASPTQVIYTAHATATGGRDGRGDLGFGAETLAFSIG